MKGKFIFGFLGFVALLAAVLLLWGLAQKGEPESYAVQAAREKSRLEEINRGDVLSSFFSWWLAALLVVVLLGIVAAIGLWVYRSLHHSKLMEIRALAEANTLLPNPSGDYPARITAGGVISLAPGNGLPKPVPTHLTYSPHTIYKTEGRTLVAEPPALPQIAEGEIQIVLPTAPSWSSILAGGFEPTAKRMLLGYDQKGALYGGIGSLLSTAIAGRPGQGKSTLLRLIFAQVVMLGGDCVILDPHGSIAGDLPITDGTIIASTGEEMDTVASILVATLNSRLAEYRKGHRIFTPMLVLADEFPVIALSSKAANEALARIVLEARKVEIYALISGQGLPADRFGGSLVRDALSSRYVFKTTAQQGRMAGLDKDTVKLLDMLDVGRAIFDGPVEPVILAIPQCETGDLVKLTPEIPATKEQKSERKASIEDALTAWRAGAESITKLENVLGISRRQATNLRSELEKRGLI